MTFNEFAEMIFTTLDFPHVSLFVATSFFGPMLILSTIFSWRAMRSKQSVQIVHVCEALPDRADLVDYLVKKSREVGDEQVANYLLAFKLAGKVDSKDELQKEGIRFLSEVTKNTHPQMSAELMEGAMRIMT
jgi:hypothetical protein